MDGNVDARGITADLEWLQRVGVRGVQMFEGGMGTPLVVENAVESDTDEWRDLVAHAVSDAARLELEFTIASSPGWSSAGGPWVDVDDAMQKLVWSETNVAAGEGDVALAPLPTSAGPFQDIVDVQASDVPAYARDLISVAFPESADQRPLKPSRFDASAPITDAALLTDGRFAEGIEFPRDSNSVSTAWIEQIFDEPVTVSSVTVSTPAPSGFGAAPQADCLLESSDDGAFWSPVATIDSTRLAVRTVTFTTVSARRFRLTLRGASAASALPPLAPEMVVLNVLRSDATFTLSEFALWEHPRVHHHELKAGFAAAPDYYALDTPVENGRALDPDQIIDVTEYLDDSGILRWNAPAGRWRVIRLGYSPTGHKNGPASASSTGLEVDKLDAVKVERYFAHHLSRYASHLSDDGTPRISGLLNDSIESGPQNATPQLLERFADRRGYALNSWVPALTGRIVQDPASTDRFLYDFRQTLSDLISSEYYATVSRVAHAHGLTYYAEALEDGRPQLGNDLEMRSHADVPMGAAWVFDSDTDSSRPTYVADLRGASSVAHVYGKTHTGAESMSAFHRAWSYTPRSLKHVADLELALGVTRFCIHTSPHQPSTTPAPGIALAPFLGQAFTRLETWADFSRTWIDYLSRCASLLNLGTPAVDVAVFIGEEAPVTGLFEHSLDTTVPNSIGFDYIDLTALSNVVRVENGELVASGARYRALVLGGSSSRMTLHALKRVRELADAGAVVIGSPPSASPSLSDDSLEFAELVSTMWGSGTIVDEPVASALLSRGIHPRITVIEDDVLSIGRRFDEGELVFIANPFTSETTVRVSSNTPLVSWDPVTLDREVFATEAGTHELSLGGGRSIFLLDSRLAGIPETPQPDLFESTVLEGPWVLDLPGSPPQTLQSPVAWTSLGEKSFSGRAVYRTTFSVEGADAARFRIAAQAVHEIAEVRVNGVGCGVLWTSPDRVDVTRAVREGINSLEIDVANSWMNRLIAEAGAPSGQFFAPPTTVYRADAAPQVAGLDGQVWLERSQT